MDDNLITQLILVWVGIGLLICAGALIYLIFLILQLQRILGRLYPPLIKRDGNGRKIHERF
jgi:ABC-type nickel/cobalt efflux system permease component RcnA